MARKINAVSVNKSVLNSYYANPNRVNASSFSGIANDAELTADANEVYESGTMWVNEQLKSGGTGSGENNGGSGADLLNEQGVILRKHLPDGYPYYDVVEIFSVDDAVMTDDGYPVTQPLGLEVGQTYEVVWNGTAYSCTAGTYTMDSITAVVLGDLDVLTTGEPSGAYPFVIVELPEGVAAEEGIYAACMPLDGSGTASITIRGTGEVPLDTKWLPEGYPYVLEAGITVLEETVLTASESGVFALPVSLNKVATYKVTWNGTDYIVAPKTGSNSATGETVYWGNGADLMLETSDEPFVIFISEILGSGALGYDSSTAPTIGIITEKSYIPIRREYIPGLPVLEFTGAFEGTYDTSAPLTVEIPEKLPNPNTITFTGSDGVKTYDGSSAVTVSIPRLVNGYWSGSMRGINAAEEDDEYKLGGDSIALGNGTKASGMHSHAEGYGTTASNSSSHAEGSGTTASGSGSHAEGTGTTSSGSASHSEGRNTMASGDHAHAEGYTTTASGNNSHAEGVSATASGHFSHAEGTYTTASGDDSHAEGYHTISAGKDQHVQGRYNIEDASSKYAHIVGNGTANEFRSNAHTLDWDGNAWFAGSLEGTALILTTPAGKRFQVTVDDSGVLTAAEITE